jgi:moderate conductance mechanosensitive channel
VPAWTDTLIRVAAIVVVAVVLSRLALVVVNRVVSRMESGDGRPGDLTRRSKTLASVVRSGLLAVIWVVASVTALSQAGIAVGPIIAAAGVVGIAIGFGAQNLVRDLLAGFFLLFENHYDVGDVVEVAGVGGSVEAVNLRTTVLRDLAGRRHVVPNGEIRVSTNLTKVFSRYVLTLPVPYDEDVDRAIAVLRDVADRMRREPPYRELITAPLTVLGVDAYGESSVDVACYVQTLPGEQWTVGRELRRRLKRALDEEGIAIPYPHREIVLRRADGDEPVLRRADGDEPVPRRAEGDEPPPGT